MQDSNRQSNMTKSSRGNNVGRRKKGRPEKYQKAMENFMGQFHDIEVNIRNLNQHFHAVRGHIPKINCLQKRYSLWRWHRRCQWQWRWRWPFQLTVRRHRYMTLRKKETLGKRDAAATQISSHYRHGGLAGSTSQENVEAVVESYHSETKRFLCNESPKGQDQPGGSAQGMWPDYPSSIELHTSKEGCIDSPSLSNGSRGSSLLFSSHEEGFSQEASPRTGNSPNESQEGGEHGQICPLNCLSKSPTFSGIRPLNWFRKSATCPGRIGEDGQICPPNEMSNSPTFPGIRPLNWFRKSATCPGRIGEDGQICPPNEMSNSPTFPGRVGEDGQIAPPDCVSVSQTSSRCCWWVFIKTPSGSYSYSPTSPKRPVCNALSPNSCISYTPEIPVLGYNSGSSSDKNDSNSLQDYNQAYYSPSPPKISDILMDQIMEHLDRLQRFRLNRTQSDAMETEQAEDANGQTLHSASLKEPQEDSNHTENSDPAGSGDSVIIIEDSNEEVTELNQANHTKYSDPAGSGDSVIIIEDSNEEVTDLNQANDTKFSGLEGSRDSVIVIEDSSEEDTELNQAEGSQVIERNDQAEGSHPTEVSKINEDSQFQEHGSHGRASLEPLPPGLPPNPLNWSVQDVILFLTHSGSTTFKLLADVCELYEIDGLALLLLDCEVLTRHMGIQEGPALTLYNFIKTLRETFFK